MYSLADAILAEQTDAVRALLQQGAPVNEVDEYGFTPLIEAAIADNYAIAKLLLEYGAMPNLVDMLGSTALHWAAENNNLQLAKLLLQHRANPNAYNLAGQPVLTMPFLRQQRAMKKLLLSYGAELIFTQDYINAKLIGHMFELVGTAAIVAPNREFVEVDFEGFFLEISLGLIADSVAQFKNHFAARKLRNYASISDVIVDTITRAGQLLRYQQYRINVQKHQPAIQALLQQEPLLIPVGYEGHAMTFIKFGNILVKCDRREDSRQYDNVMIYQIGHPAVMNSDFIQHLLYEKQSDYFINEELERVLTLQPITELKVAAQISGNCSWANVEACIPALFFLLYSRMEGFDKDIVKHKNTALSFFQQWREWNKDRALQFCIQSFNEADPLRKACKAEILAAILYQCCNGVSPVDGERAEKILAVLAVPKYEYILKNYVKSYCYEDYSEEGKRFLQLLRDCGYKL